MQELELHSTSGSTRILVGEDLSEQINSISPGTILLVDEHVLSLYPDLFDTPWTIAVPTGESNKTLQTVESLYRELVELGADRSGLIIGVGGGLTTDIAGFIASTYMRGTRFGFISTTLLGQVDASIGGKNGVNLDGYKNMIGVIRQPEFIWCDCHLLKTQEEHEYRSGIAEVIKYGAIRDLNLLKMTGENMPALLNQDRKVLGNIIKECIRIKASVVENDELEAGERRILNFGHTLGHAIERNYKLLHGEAIAIGMLLAARISAIDGLISDQDVNQLKQIIEAAGLPTEIKLDPDEILNTVLKDKKKEGLSIHFVLLKALGEAVIKEVSIKEIKQILNDLC